MSIENQYDDISDICEREGYELKDVLDYKEKRSGWERGNKKPRKEFTRMLSDIDKLKTPCILLARNSSRLARNMEDGLELIYRLRGIHGKKKNIEKVVFADSKEYWSSETSQGKIQSEFSKNFNESEETSKGVRDGYAKTIKAMAYPYGRDNLPKGLTLTRVSGRNYITPTADMEHIIVAFQMKLEGKTQKEISKYLELFGISITPRSVTKNLLVSKLYIGYLVIKKDGKSHPMKFYKDGEFSLAPLIPPDLWEDVQKTLGKKHSSHGEKFKDTTLCVKTEKGGTMSKAVVKGKFTYYNNSYEKINIAEWRLIEGYLQYIKSLFLQKRGGIQKIVAFEYQKEKNHILKELQKRNITVISTGNDIEFSNLFINDEVGKSLVRDYLINEAVYELAMSQRDTPYLEGSDAQKYIDRKSSSLIQLDIEESLEERLSSIRKARKNQIRILQTELEENDKARKRAIYFYTREEMEKPEYDTAIEMANNDEKRINNEIAELQKGDELDEYLEKIPNILLQTLELLGNVLYKEKIQELNDDLMALIKLTTLKLVVTSKKELKVKLFDTLQKIILRESLCGRTRYSVRSSYIVPRSATEEILEDNQ